jgi:hypothetical protein
MDADALPDREERADGPDVVTYHFPVRLEVVGELGHEELRRVARYVFDELDASLRDAH